MLLGASKGNNQTHTYIYACVLWENIWSLSAGCEYRLKSGLGQRAGWMGVRGWCCKDKNVADLTNALCRTIFCPVTDSTAPQPPFIPQEISPPSQGFPAKHRFHKFSPESSHIQCLCFPRKSFELVSAALNLTNHHGPLMVEASNNACHTAQATQRKSGNSTNLVQLT